MKGFVSSVATLAAISVFAAESTVSDNITVKAGETLVINVGDGDTETYTGAITGHGAVKKTGSGKLVLAGANAFSGGFRLEAGKVQADNATAFGTASVTNASSVSGTQLIFNVPNGVFANDILLLGSKSSTLIFQQSTTFDGDIRLSKETNFESPNNSSLVVRFNGRVLGGVNILYKIYGNAHFNSPLSLNALYAGAADSSVGRIHLYSSENEIRSGCILWKGSVVCHAENVIGGNSLGMRQALANTEGTIFDLNGYNQSVSHITPSSGSNPSVSAIGGQITSSAAATLAITGMQAGDSHTSYFGVSGNVSLVLDSDPSFKQVFARRKSGTEGSIDVKSGVFEMSEEAAFTNVTSISVGAGGTFLMNSTAEVALERVASLKVAGAFSVGSGSPNPFASDLVMELGETAKISLPGDMVLRVKSLTVNGVAVGGKIAAGDIPQILSGELIVETAESSDAWTGAGENTSVSLASNWSSGKNVDLLGGMAATFASSSAVGFVAEVEQDVFFRNITLSASDGFDFTGTGTIGVDGGIVAERRTMDGSPVYSFMPGVRFLKSQTLSFEEETTVKFVGGSVSGTSGESVTLSKTGMGTLEVLGSNVWNGAFIVSNGAVNLTGTITTSQGVDETAIGGDDDHRSVSLHMSTQSGASGDCLLCVSNAVIEKPVWFSMGEHSSTSFFNFPEGTTNVFRGFFHSADAANQRFRLLGADTAVVFEGGGKFPWNFYQTGSGAVYFRNKPFVTSFGNASHYYCVWGGESGSGTAVFEVGGNTMKWLSVAGDGGTIDMRVDNVLDAESSIKMEGGWQRGKMGSVLRLNDTFQTVGCIIANTKANDYSWIEGTGATLYVTNNTATRNSLCALDFKGDISLWFDAPGTMTLTNAISANAGGIKVSRGVLAFCHDAAWTNASEVAICGDGCVKLLVADGEKHSVAIGKDATLSFENNGVLDIPDGVSVRVKNLIVDGVKMPRGRYGYACSSNDNIRKHFVTGSTGFVSVHGEGAFSITIR